MILRLFLGFGLIALALLALYWPSLASPLIFDDSLLERPEFLASYEKLWPLKVRALAYGSFAWWHDAIGIASALQRLINVALHAMTVLALAWFYLRLMPYFGGDQVRTHDASTSWSDATATQQCALLLGIAAFAFNPVAVYAVAYLIQRSILLCALFSVLALIATITAAERGGRFWLLVVACYVAAMVSKEYAIALPAVCAAVVIVVRRPPTLKVVRLSALMAVIGALMSVALYSRYGRIIGSAFDENSLTYLRQLNSISPGTKDIAWPLSILNQTWLFFEYGWRWFFPNVAAMSIDMRPPFPLDFSDAKYWVSAFGYASICVGSVVLILRFRDWRGLLGFSLWVPCVLFVTEFATVWVQDPFVLYRSYLWAIGVPGVILALAFAVRISAVVSLAAAAIVSAIFIPLSLDRVKTMQSAFAVWDDAAKKIPPYLTVGQSRIFNNRGMASMGMGDRVGALRDFRLSTRLGDGGEGLLNTAILAMQDKQFESAQMALAGARKRGMDSAVLNYNQGLVSSVLGRLEESEAAFKRALERDDRSSIESSIRSKRALVLIDLRRLREAKIESDIALALAPNDADAQQSAAFVMLASGDASAAIKAFDRQLASRNDVLGLYGRARARLQVGDRDGALNDLDQAITLDPTNLSISQLRTRIANPPANAAAQPHTQTKPVSRP